MIKRILSQLFLWIFADEVEKLIIKSLQYGKLRNLVKDELNLICKKKVTKE